MRGERVKFITVFETRHLSCPNHIHPGHATILLVYVSLQAKALHGQDGHIRLSHRGFMPYTWLHATV
jgi:hypothetical protein